MGGPAGSGDFAPRWGNSYANPATGLPPDGLGWGRGLMQIDYSANHAWVTSNPWQDPQTSINKAADIYRTFQSFFQQPHQGESIAIDYWRVHNGLPSANVLPWLTKYGGSYPGSAPDPRPLSGDQLREATVAAYNAGTAGPLQALAVGLPAEAVTANQNYVSTFLRYVPQWVAAFKNLTGG